MKKNLTELIFIIDRSGSMHGLEDDTIGGFNSMLEKQKEAEGEVIVSTVLFNDRTEVLQNRLDIHDVEPLARRDYRVGGCTALLDAVGKSIDKIVNVQRRLPDESRAEKVIFVIITDGYENASREYTYNRIKKMIDLEQDKYGWEFIFLGANIDAVAEGARFGIREDRAVRYKSDAEGTVLNYDVVATAVCEMRCASQRIDGRWKDRIEDDVRRRGE